MSEAMNEWTRPLRHEHKRTSLNEVWDKGALMCMLIFCVFVFFVLLPWYMGNLRCNLWVRICKTKSGIPALFLYYPVFRI